MNITTLAASLALFFSGPCLLCAGSPLSYPEAGLGEGYTGYTRAPFWISNGQFARVAQGAENPFAGADPAARALHVTNDLSSGQPAFSLRARLWEEAGPQKGKVEIPLRLIKGAVRINLGTNPAPLSEARDTFSLKRDQIHYVLVLATGSRPRVHTEKALPTRWREDAEIAPESTLLITVEWDLSEKPFFRLSMDGSPVLLQDGDADWAPAATLLSQGGINAVGVTTTGSSDAEYYIGPVTFGE